MIPVNIPVNTYSGNSSTTIFDFDFLIKKSSELSVLHTDENGLQVELKLNIDYTINEIGNDKGSFITFPILGSSYNKLSETEILSLVLNLPLMQETPYGTSAKLDLKTLEYSLDYIIRCLQMLDRKQERSIKVQEGSSQTADDLINALNQAQINAMNSATQAKTSEVEAKQSADIAQTTKDELLQNAEKTISEIDTLGNSKNELIIQSGNNKIEEINNTINNIQGSVISGRFIGELILANMPILLADGSIPLTLRLTNGDWINQNGMFNQATEHIKMVASLCPNIVCNNEDYEAMLLSCGECPKFVIDNETGMLRLPTIKSILQGISSLQDLGSVIQAGLPNITGALSIGDGAFFGGCNGAFKSLTGYSREDPNTGNAGASTANFDASNYNPIYGKAETVQPQTTKAAYYIVLATSVDQNIKAIQNIQVVNQEFNLLQHITSDKLINNPCWLRSCGQWNNSDNYPAVWNYLLEQFNNGTMKTKTIEIVVDNVIQEFVIDYVETSDLLRIVDVSNDLKVENLYKANGSAWYYVIDIAKMRFKLPQSENYIGFTSDSHKDNGEIQPAVTKFYLYFKVGNSLQNLQLVNVGRIDEKLQDLILQTPDKNLSNIASNIDYVVESYIEGTAWCKIYKSGWHEEGNLTGSIGYDGVSTQNFIKPYKSVLTIAGSTNYVQYNGDKRASWRICSLTNTYIQFQARFEQGGGNIWWVTYGY